MEYFANFLHRNVGEIKIPLYYVIHKSDTVPGGELSIMIVKSYSEEHGYTKKDLK